MTTITLNIEDYQSKVLGCWLGKNIGGTLGAPFEWRRQINDVSFYIQDLGGEPLPNDDLDIQLLWLIALEEKGLEIDAHTLAEYWTLYVTPHWSEYGTAKVHMRAGLPPPLCGTHGNLYKDSCGAFIRSEIWACVAPGDPRRAVRFAYADAILDHGDGEGTYAEMFCAALESAAFVCSDLRALIELALSYIPADSGCAGAVRLAMEAYDSGKTWRQARDLMLEKYRGETFFGWQDWTSPEDQEKGFGTGKRGWDAPDNLGITAIGLLYGEGDFEKTICIAVNCGEDTDCTAATAGALFGILYGADAIPEKWIAPIGRSIKTACLNLGELGFYGDQLPQTVDALTERTVRLGKQASQRGGPVTLSETLPTDLSGIRWESLQPDPKSPSPFIDARSAVYKFDFFEIAVDYGPEGPSIRAGQPKTITLNIRNTYKVQAVLHLRWYASDGWSILPTRTGSVLSVPSHLGPAKQVVFQLETGVLEGSIQRMVLEIVIDSRPSVMLVPIVLWNAALDGETVTLRQ